MITIISSVGNSVSIRTNISINITVTTIILCLAAVNSYGQTLLDRPSSMLAAYDRLL